MPTTNILLVEDEPAIQELLAFNLTQCGFNAICALDAASAMTHIRNTIPDLILMDWMLPDISGIELTRRLRTEQPTHSIPIIMLTGLSEECNKLMGFESGVDDYVTKPFSPRELIARIRAVLRNSEAKIEGETVSAGGIELSLTSRRISAKGSQIELGPTEFNILHFLSRVAERSCLRSAPSEPDVGLSIHTAQASAKASFDTRFHNC
jgi:two-component system phosphate regulon response regulator PhoB